MSFNTRTPEDIKKLLETEAALSTGTQRAALTGTPESMIVRCQTIVASELYSYINYISQQILPTTSDDSFLEQHATFWLEQARKQPSVSTGKVRIEGTNGLVIPAGSFLQRADGENFTTDSDVTISDGFAVVQITSEKVGAALNTDGGISLAFNPPIAGVTSVAVDAASLTSGADLETNLGVINRVLDRVQNPPHGGTLKDYETWAVEVDGVTRAWAKESDDSNTVTVTFVMDNKQGTLVPSAEEIQETHDYIETKRPVGARLVITAPTAVPVDFEIGIAPNTVAVQNAVKAELEEFFKREGTAAGSTLYYSRISEVISLGAGENHHRLISPNESQSFAFGEIPVLGTITWSTAT